MMAQAEYMDIPALRKQDWTLEGRRRSRLSPGHCTGVAKAAVDRRPSARSIRMMMIDQRWVRRIDELPQGNKDLLGTSIDRLLRAEGFEGSYTTGVTP